MSVVVDSFAGSAGADLASRAPDVGSWAKSSDSSETGAILLDGSGGVNANGGRAVYFHSLTPASADYQVRFTIRYDPSKPFGVNRFVIARNDGTSYHAVMGGIGQDGNWVLWQDYNQIGSANKPEPSVVTDYDCILNPSGSKASLTVDGVLVIPPTNITYTGPGRIGLWMQDGNASNSRASIRMLQFDDGTSPTPTPTLTISPTTATAGSGVASVSLTALLANASGTISATATGGGTFSTNTPTSGTPFDWIKPVTGSGTATITVTSGSLTATATIAWSNASGGPTTVPVTDSRLYFSPYNWDSTGSGSLASNNVRGSSTFARSNNPGAYLKTAVTVGSGGNGSISLLLDTTTLQGVAPYGPRLMVTIDGGNPAFATLTYSASQVVLPLATGLAAGTHTVRVDFQGTITSGAGHDDVDRWVTPANAVRVAGLQVDAGSAIAAPTVYPNALLVFGDSIAEGIRTFGGGTNPGDQDATAGFARLLADALRCEIGIVGYGGQGYQFGGFGGVPALPSAWSLYSAGRSRLAGGALQPAPKYILDEHGANGPTTSANVQTQLGLYRAAAPAAWIFKATPFPYTSASAITAGVAAYQAANPGDSKAALLDTGGSLATARTASDGTHPNGLGHGQYAGSLALQIGLATGGGGGGGETVVLPAAGQVLADVTFGPSGSPTTGTVVLPAAGQVLDGVGFGAGGTQFEGSLAIAGGGDDDTGLTAQQVQAACAAAIAAAKVRLDLDQPLADVTTATLGGALHGAWAVSWGKVVKDRVNRLLKVFGIGSQSAPAKVFALDNADNPQTKVPQ